MLADPFRLLLKLKTKTFKKLSRQVLYPIIGKKTPGRGVQSLGLWSLPCCMTNLLWPHTCCVTSSQTLNHPVPNFPSLKEMWLSHCAFVLKVMRELQGVGEESTLGHWQVVGLDFLHYCPLLVHCMLGKSGGLLFSKHAFRVPITGRTPPGLLPSPSDLSGPLGSVQLPPCSWNLSWSYQWDMFSLPASTPRALWPFLTLHIFLVNHKHLKNESCLLYLWVQ